MNAPLRFREILRNYSFGGRWIPQVFSKPALADLPSDHRIAETWEVCDRPGESSVVSHGPLAGRTLRELIDTFGEALLGRDIVAGFGMRFPLLVKFLDATHTLGAQIHPGDELARVWNSSDTGKTEAWYMIHTRPGATLRCGNTTGLTPQGLRQAMDDGRIQRAMVEHAVWPGDAVLLYAGAMHYSAGGLLFYEIMQNSDITVGLGPWRDSMPPADKQRALDRAMAGVHLEDGADYRPRPVVLDEAGAQRTFVLACREFALERLDLVGACDVSTDGRRFCILTQVAGESVIRAGEHEEQLLAGQSCLLPAGLGSAQVTGDVGASLLKAYVPELVADIIRPLRARGVADGDIAGLGARTRLNPLPALLEDNP